MVYRLIGFAFVVLELLMINVCGIIGISKIKLFNFSGTERIEDEVDLFLVFNVLLFFASGFTCWCFNYLLQVVFGILATFVSSCYVFEPI